MIPDPRSLLASSSSEFPGLVRLQTSTPLMAGVAARTAARLGADPLVVRVAFLVLASALGFGVLVYGIIWLLSVGRPEPQARIPSTRHNLAIMVLTLAGLTWVSGEAALPVAVVVAVAVVLFGLTLAGDRAADLLGSAAIRSSIGALLIVVGLATTVEEGFFRIERSELMRLVIALVVIVAGAVLMALPFVLDFARSARDDRRARIRAEERADVAAHLHDSVLQTLTLIQNRADDPKVIAALAHQQERELRDWLYGGPGDEGPPSTFRAALVQAAAEVEDQYLRAIECVVVGNCELSEQASNAVAAAREAMINAAKFADVPLISVYAEVSDEQLRCFVRDRGVGFEPDAVPADRRGITDSIQGRVERSGGTALIKAKLGEGTEVRIEVPR